MKIISYEKALKETNEKEPLLQQAQGAGTAACWSFDSLTGTDGPWIMRIPQRMANMSLWGQEMSEPLWGKNDYTEPLWGKNDYTPLTITRPRFP